MGTSPRTIPHKSGSIIGSNFSKVLVTIVSRQRGFSEYSVIKIINKSGPKH